MSYYQLVCETHDEEFKPVLATSPEELLAPDYEDAAQESGRLNAERLEEFHQKHSGCALTTKLVVSSALTPTMEA